MRTARDGAADTKVGHRPPPPQQRDAGDTTALASMATADYGVLAWFNREFGFGFITPDEDGPDVFVHLSQIPDGCARVPTVGQRVSYRLAGTPRRPEAHSVQLL